MMEYNKNITRKGIPKDRFFPFRSEDNKVTNIRRIPSVQQVNTAEISAAVANELRNQITHLTQELMKKEKSSAEFTAEEVDDEIRKAVSGAVKETQDNTKHELSKLTTRNVELEKELTVINATLQSKEIRDTEALTRRIEELTRAVAASKDSDIGLDPDRPQMEEIFIDPLSKDSGKNLESHVDIKDSTSKEKVNVDVQVDKLKNLLGKLPNIKK